MRQLMVYHVLLTRGQGPDDQDAGATHKLGVSLSGT